jgi:hypothetical protein
LGSKYYASIDAFSNYATLYQRKANSGKQIAQFTLTNITVELSPVSIKQPGVDKI